jgi:MFS family permease
LDQRILDCLLETIAWPPKHSLPNATVVFCMADFVIARYNPLRFFMRRTWNSSDRYFFAFVLSNMAQGGASLLLPLFVAQVLNGDNSDVGLVTGLASLAGVPASILWGRLSDKWKRRKIFVLVGMFGVSISLALMAFTQSVWQMMLANVLINTTWLASAAVATLIAIEGLEKERWDARIGRFNRFGGLGWVTGLIIGSFWMQLVTQPVFDPAHHQLSDRTIRYLFLVLSALALLGAVWAVVWIRESPVKLDQRRFESVMIAVANLWERFKFAPQELFHIISNPSKLLEAFRNREGLGKTLRVYFMATVLFFCGFSAMFVPFPLFLKNELGLNGSEIFALFVIHSGTSALTNPWAGTLAQRYGSRFLQRIFLGVRVIIFAIAPAFMLLKGQHTAALFTIAFFFLLTGVSWAFVNVCAVSIISKRAPMEQRGQALGTYNALSGIGSILGAFTGGYLADHSYLIDFLFAAAMVGIALLILFWWARQKSPLPKPS